MSGQESEREREGESETERAFYVIHCLDDLSCGMVEQGERFGGSVKRIGCYPAHRAYQAAANDTASPHYIKKIAAGPMESEDQKYMIGSCFIVEATREEAERFNRNDPFYANGVWKEIQINRWISPTTGIKAAVPVTQNNDPKTVKMQLL